MSFLAPAFFWAFLALIPLIAIYFLKVRPRRKTTNAYFLWEKIFEERKTSSLFSRLRDLFSLLLLMLVFSAIVLALTRPELADDSRKDLLILVDHSASMSAGEGGGTRLEMALDTAREIVLGLNHSQRAAVAVVASEVVFRSHVSDNPRLLLDVIDGIGATDLPLKAEALDSLNPSENKQWAENHRVLFLTDGCFARNEVAEGIEIMKIGNPLKNVGIVAADLQYVPGGTNRLGLYFQVASSFPEKVAADLIVRRAESEAIVKLIPLELVPGVNPPEVFVLENAEPGKWVAEIDMPDALSKDNRVFLAASKPPPINVGVSSEDRYFLENAVIAFTGEAGLLALKEDNPELMVSKGLSPDADMGIIFQPEGDSPWWNELGEPLEIAVPRVLIESHPALRHLDAASIPFLSARELKAPEGALVLVASDEGLPLIYRVNREGRSAFVVNMDPVAAEFYYSAWFPILVHGMATSLAGREESLVATYQPGRAVPAPGVRVAEEVSEVTLPDGVTAQVAGKEYGPLQNLGFHELTNQAGRWLIGCSLLAPAESLLDNSGVTATAEPLSKGFSPALLLTIFAILILVLESLLYHRRKVG
ncbi:MAG: BatA and WFA domain-containing protein [Verrucomicrobiota bacterium]